MHGRSGGRAGRGGRARGGRGGGGVKAVTGSFGRAGWRAPLLNKFWTILDQCETMFWTMLDHFGTIVEHCGASIGLGVQKGRSSLDPHLILI